MMNNNEEMLEPLAVSIETTSRITGESKTQVYNLIQDGEYQAVKSGRRTLIVFASIKRRLTNLPKVEIKRKRRKVRS
jgi:hypothetical protein